MWWRAKMWFRQFRCWYNRNKDLEYRYEGKSGMGLDPWCEWKVFPRSEGEE